MPAIVRLYTIRILRAIAENEDLCSACVGFDSCDQWTACLDLPR